MGNPSTVPLSQGLVALVDAADLDRVLAAGPWHASRNRNSIYAQRKVTTPTGRRTEKMHTFLTGYAVTDHINGDGLDNRRANLRPTSPSRNRANAELGAANTSGFKGVSWHRRARKWRATIRVNKRYRHIGVYVNPEDAARAYDAAAREAFGAHAALNFPREGEQHTARKSA